MKGKLLCSSLVYTNEGQTPVFRPKRPVAYAMYDTVNQELDRLEQANIITPVEYSEWAAPIVVVRKASGTIRICGDYSTGLNDALQPHQYPLPLPQDIFAKLANCKIFSQIDLSGAYLQVEVDEASRDLLTVNTHRGLYRYYRLPPGVKASPGAFQQLVDTMLIGLKQTSGYIDDVIAGGVDEVDNQLNLQAVLQRVQEYGFTIKMEKCSFGQPQIKYLGHLIDGRGLRPDPAKIQAIRELPAPTAVSGFRSNLGAISYYELPIIVSADASSVGVGATLSHKMPDASVKVVQHASRALTPTEQGPCNRVCGYQVPRDVVRSQLSYSNGSRSSSPHLWVNRLQRWALQLLLYDFKIEYVSIEKFGNADVLSRLIAHHARPDEDLVVASVILEEDLRSVAPNSISFRTVQQATQTDLVLGKVYRFGQQGWPKSRSAIADLELQKYYDRQDSSVVQGCVMFAERLAIPAQFRDHCLHQLHRGHPGVQRRKAIARSYVYWPSIDADIAAFVKTCCQCASVAKSPPKAPSKP
ncbi:uncharacterized protein K02A2.6-like [Ochlerotatus camptorhynchus]|uniref:uncharacterized protein K02A2.6-like n=1 Tax=Ochlerotatus camptorhynchus TaxID=644619 RepID=UPI0031E271BA